MSELSVVIATWNCKKYVEECLHSFRQHVRISSEVIVVDNASTDGTAEMIAQQFPEVRLIRSADNVGFARANNIGILASNSRYLALINPDVKLLAGCVERALAAIEAEPSVGMLGPGMIGRDGSVHRSGMRFPTLWNLLCDALALHRVFGRRPIFGGHLMADFNWDSSRDVDVLSGWFWLIRRDALREVGLLDEQFFMYGEDLDWCKRFRDAGWRVVFEPKAAAIHYGGGSSEQAPIRFCLEMQRSNQQYWNKHHPRITRPLYVAIVSLHSLVRLVRYWCRQALRANDVDTRYKVRLYAECLRHLLLGTHTQLR